MNINLPIINNWKMILKFKYNKIAKHNQSKPRNLQTLFQKQILIFCVHKFKTCITAIFEKLNF